MDKAEISKSLELPESVYTELVRAASARGTTPVGWIQEHLPKNGGVGKTDGVSGEQRVECGSVVAAAVFRHADGQ
jgi:hypothetical protein